MTAQVVNVELDPGSDSSVELDWTNPSTNLPIDLTGYSAKMQVRSRPYDGTILLDYTSGNGKLVLGGALGTIKILFSAADTNTGTWFNGTYDLYIVKIADGSTTRVASGFVTILKQITLP